MVGFLDSVEAEYDTRNLYEVLGISKTAKQSDIKRAYHKLSLKVHPDRAKPDEVEAATRKFQVSHTSIFHSNLLIKLCNEASHRTFHLYSLQESRGKLVLQSHTQLVERWVWFRKTRERLSWLLALILSCFTAIFFNIIICTIR